MSHQELVACGIENAIAVGHPGSIVGKDIGNTKGTAAIDGDDPQSACSDSADRWLRSRSLEPSGERSPSEGAAISLGMESGSTSPFAMETCDNRPGHFQ